MTAKTTNRRKIIPILLALLGVVAFGLIVTFLLKDANVALLNPKGFVANEQTWLLVASTLIMLGFGVPIILTIYFFAWKYRENNQGSTFAPETKNNNAFLLFAWGGPLVIVMVLASLMLPATKRLEPQAPIKAARDQVTVQVVALNWKWLFIYPEQDLATINFAQIPVDTPVRFELTADGAPMSSFWIPNLGGMLYAMTGHVNPLNLIGDTVGDFPGSSAEINGKGYAGMKFTTRVSTQKDFDTWVAETKKSPVSLSESEYQKLLEPSENNKPAFYSRPSPGLYGGIVKKYNEGHQHGGTHEGYGSH